MAMLRGWRWPVLGLAVAAALAAVVLLRGESPPRTVVSLTFDDGFASQLTAETILASHGDRATFYINSARLGTDRRLTKAQVRMLAAEGHEIGGHTLDHVNLPTVKRPARLREICDDRAALAKLVGAEAVVSFAYPYGALGPQVQRDVAACGYSSARTVGGLDTGHGECADCPATEPVPAGDLFRVRSLPSFVPDTPIAMAQQQVRRAQKAGGGWVPLVFHEVCDGCSQLAITPAHFRELVDWLHAEGIPIRTVGEMVGGGARPVVTAEAAARVHTTQVALVDPRGAGGSDPGFRIMLLGAVALLFGLPIGGLAVLRATGRW